MKKLRKRLMSWLMVVAIMFSTFASFMPMTVHAAAPETPTGFTLDNTVLRWNAVSGATEYTIGIYEGASNVATYTTSNNWWNLAQNYLASGTYSFFLHAKNADGNSTPASIQRFYLESGKTEVNSISATITEPTAGASPATTVTSSEPSKYNAVVSQISGQYKWFKGGTTGSPGTRMTEGEKFEAGETYIVEIEFSPEGNNVFNVTAANVTLNGKTGSASGTNGYKKYFRFAFTVSSAPKYAVEPESINLNSGGGTAYEGYEPNNFQTIFRMKITGTEEINARTEYYKVELTSGHTSSFDVWVNNGNSFQSGSTYNGGSLKPKAGLSAGTYTATYTVYYDEDGTGTTHDWVAIGSNQVKFTVTGSTTQHTVTFDAQDGNPPTVVTVNAGEAVAKPADPTYGNLEFEKWYKDNGNANDAGYTYNFSTPVTGDITLKAYWKYSLTANAYPAEYGLVTTGNNFVGATSTKTENWSGFTANKDGNLVGFQQKANLGYKFKEWRVGSPSGQVVGTDSSQDFYTSSTGEVIYIKQRSNNNNTVFYAIFEPVTPSQHTVTFMDGSTELTSLRQQVNDGEKATMPTTDPTKANHRFDGWYEDATFGTPFDFTKPITTDTPIYAKFVEQFNITVDYNGGTNNGFTTMPLDKGTVLNRSDIELSFKDTSLITPPTDKEFDYIEVDGNKWTDSTYTLNSNVTMKIIWKDKAVTPTEYLISVRSYDIALNKEYSGGQVSVKTDHGGGMLVDSGYGYDATVGTEVEINAVAAPGYEFVEWRNGSATGTTFATKANYKFTVTDTWLTLYAIFKEQEYTSKFDLNGGSGKNGFTPMEIDIPTDFESLIPTWDELKDFIEAPFGKVYVGVEINGKKVNPGVNYKPTGDVTVKLLWEDKYKILDGANQTYTIGSNKDIVITASGEKANLSKIKIDGADLDVANYTTADGSTILTLKASYLDTLSVGDHTVEFAYGDGSASTTLKVVKNNTSDGSNPKTNDNIVAHIVTLSLSLFGIAGASVYVNRKKLFNR